MKTYKTLFPLKNLTRRMILFGLTALALASPVLRAQSALAAADTAPSPSRVDKRPDLIIEDIVFLGTADGYDKSRVFVQVRNQGLSNSKPSTLTLTTTGAFGTVQSSAQVPALQSGEMISVTVLTTVGEAERQTTNHYAVDVFNTVNEANEFNNTYDLDFM
jgi:subtilase family serine protease